MEQENLTTTENVAADQSTLANNNDKQQRSMEKNEAAIKELTGKSKKKTIFMVIFLIANVLAILLTAINEFGGSKDAASPGEVLSVWFQNWYFLLLAFAFLGVNLICETLKFAFFIKNATGKFNLRLAWKCMIQGKYYDGITPSSIGGQPFQVYYLAKSGIEAGKSTSIAITCFFLTQFTFSVMTIILMSIFGTTLLPNELLITGYVGAVLATTTPVLLIIASFIPKTSKRLCCFLLRLLTKIKIIKDYNKAEASVLEYIDNYSDSVKHMREMKGTIAVNALLSIMANLANACIPYFVILCCGESLPFIHVVAMCFVTYASVSFIPTPGSSGAAEASFYLVFSVLSGGFLFMGMLLWRTISFYAILLIGLFVVIGGFSGKNKKVLYGNEQKK